MTQLNKPYLSKDGPTISCRTYGNKGKEKDLHIPRKMHILLNRKASIMLKSHQEDVNIQVEKAI
jgi:hypothetical protein